MKRFYFFLTIAVISAVSCNKMWFGEVLDDDNFGKAELSVNEMDGIWRINKRSATIVNGVIEDHVLLDAVPGRNTTNYLEFNETGLVADYTHYIFYDAGSEEECVLCEYVIDNKATDITFDFDKNSRKGKCHNMNSVADGDLVVLESDNTTVRLLLLDYNENADDRIIILTKINDDELVNKLKTWPHRDYDKMLDEVEKL